MTLATERPTPEPITPETATQTPPDQRITIQGGWEQFKLIQQGCEKSSKIRLSYFEETIEILMPSRAHEIFSHLIGYLLTCCLSYQDIEFLAVGSADQEKAGEASAQPDQSYCLGGMKPIPDLSIEVVFSSGGQRKLDRYQTLGVTEVWFWEDGTLKLYHLRSEGYEPITQSELEGLRNLDLEVLKQHILMGETDTGAAARSFLIYLQSQT